MSDEENQIKEGVIDKVEEMFKMAKVELEKVQCPDHGQALKKLDFNRDIGRFDIECCCDGGEKLVEAAIATI